MPLRGTHKLDEFEVVEVIGSGQYGICKKVRKKSDGKVILKEAQICPLFLVADFCLEGTGLRSND